VSILLLNGCVKISCKNLHASLKIPTKVTDHAMRTPAGSTVVRALSRYGCPIPCGGRVGLFQLHESLYEMQCSWLLPVAEHVASNLGVKIAKRVVTHGAPNTVVFDFQSSLYRVSSGQSHFWTPTFTTLWLPSFATVNDLSSVFGLQPETKSLWSMKKLPSSQFIAQRQKVAILKQRKSLLLVWFSENRVHCRPDFRNFVRFS